MRGIAERGWGGSAERNYAREVDYNGFVIGLPIDFVYRQYRKSKFVKTSLLAEKCGQGKGAGWGGVGGGQSLGVHAVPSKE